MGIHNATLVESGSGEPLSVVLDRPLEARLSPIVCGWSGGLRHCNEPQARHGTRPHQFIVI